MQMYGYTISKLSVYWCSSNVTSFSINFDGGGGGNIYRFDIQLVIHQNFPFQYFLIV